LETCSELDVVSLFVDQQYISVQVAAKRCSWFHFITRDSI